ncbi:cilia- and flagella-associated protein 418-like isoform X1 [Macrobrachium rosenbergii]|uniref:cilia- and flagella-associated protein 418-like isoform X1 n=1 Tax=Macrobrachium rosenbergii TaxID=79674 RepID=UPI0034D3AFCE
MIWMTSLMKLRRHCLLASERVNHEDKRSVKTDDLNDLLDDFELPPPSPLRSGSATLSHEESPKRCTTPLIGGTSLPLGMTTVATKRSCDQLRCIKCDSPVIFFEGFIWTEDTDYLFLRNNYPDLERLRSHLDSLRGGRAYACQCSFRSVEEPLSLEEDTELQWVCVHKVDVQKLNSVQDDIPALSGCAVTLPE